MSPRDSSSVRTGGRFVAKYITFGQNDNFARILQFKEVSDPTFLDTSLFSSLEMQLFKIKLP